MKVGVDHFLGSFALFALFAPFVLFASFAVISCKVVSELFIKFRKLC